MVERYKYKCIDAYEEPENPMEWLPCPRCGLRPLVWKFDNGRATACGCGTDCYSHWSVQAESIMSVIKRSDSCEGCVFNNSKNYYCKDTHCIDVDRKDDIDVIYKEVKRS